MSDNIYQMLMTASNAPKRHRQTVEEPIEGWTEACAKLERIQPGYTLALIGGRDTGKTQLAVAIIKLTCSSLKTALYATATEFFMDIKEAYSRKSSEREVIQTYRKPFLLVLDEFGKRGETEWHNTLMFELLNKRYNDMANTILIDNRTKKEFIAAVGPSIARRIAETGGIIECNWNRI